MVRHLIFIVLVVLIAIAVTQFGFLHPHMETLAANLTPATLALYDKWIPPPSLFTFFDDQGTPFSIGNVAVTVRLADTPEEQGIGLGGLRRIREDEGLLYIYPRPDFHTHNMKDMRFPLDIIWIGKDKKIVDVIANVLPDTYPDYAYVNDFLAQYVLEIRAGFFDAHKLKIGDAVEFEIEKSATK